MTDVDIRPCTDQDLEALRSRWPAAGDVHGKHHARQSAGHATYLVAWRGDEPLGSGMVQWDGCVGPAAREAFPDAVEINHLQVREEFRGQGVGGLLVRAAEDLAARRGRTQVALGVGVDNPDAERLYLRLGYEATGVLDDTEYDWVDEDGVVHHEVERDQVLLRTVRRPAG